MSTDQWRSVESARAAGHSVSDAGIILDPGKFEGQPYWLPAFWEYVLEGGEDSLEEDYKSLFILTTEDKENFPALADVCELRIWEDDQGFVRHETFTPPYGRMCRDPALCRGKGYCPKDPTCGD